MKEDPNVYLLKDNQYLEEELAKVTHDAMEDKAQFIYVHERDKKRIEAMAHENMAFTREKKSWKDNMDHMKEIHVKTLEKIQRKLIVEQQKSVWMKVKESWSS